MKKKNFSVDCPTCGKTVEWKKISRWKPFCSERCKLIDLGDWAEGNNRIQDDPEIEPLTEVTEDKNPH